MGTDFQCEARTILRQELRSRGLTVGDLSHLLLVTGLKESESSLYRKIQRGTFQFAFFIRCIAAIRIHSGSPKSATRDVLFQLPPLETVPAPVDEERLSKDRRRRNMVARTPSNLQLDTPKRPRGRPRRGGSQAGKATDRPPAALAASKPKEAAMRKRGR